MKSGFAYKDWAVSNSKFDWYQTTFHVDCPEKISADEVIRSVFPDVDSVGISGVNGYTRGLAYRLGDDVKCKVFWGGNTGVNILSTSSNADLIARALSGKDHYPTRIDSCIDMAAPGLFDKLTGLLIQFSQDHNLTINQQGDWVRGVARTLYVGSQSSAVRLVVYEKGYERGDDEKLDWVRIEARIRPTKRQRAAAARLSAPEIFSCGWIPRAMAAMLGGVPSDGISVGTVWSKSDSEKARAALLKQYRNILFSWAGDLGGWESLGAEIGKRLEAGECAVADAE